MQLVRTPPDLLGKQNILAVNQGPSLSFPLSLSLSLSFSLFFVSLRKKGIIQQGSPFQLQNAALKSTSAYGK